MRAETPAERRARLDRAAFGLQRRSPAPRQVVTAPPLPPWTAGLRSDHPGAVVLETFADRDAYRALVLAELRFAAPVLLAMRRSARPWLERQRGED